jgi:hypothetical protein
MFLILQYQFKSEFKNFESLLLNSIVIKSCVHDILTTEFDVVSIEECATNCAHLDNNRIKRLQMANGDACLLKYQYVGGICL